MGMAFQSVPEMGYSHRMDEFAVPEGYARRGHSVVAVGRGQGLVGLTSI